MNNKGCLFLDWGECFQHFAILLVKKEKGLLVDELVDECHMCLESQLGQEKFEKIFESQEFSDLFNLNLETFEAVDEAKLDLIKASEVNYLNDRRAKAKKILHEKFFGGEYKEVKNTGYENL